MRLAWLTDIHLNFVHRPALQSRLEQVGERADAVVISGDIAESSQIEDYLSQMEWILQNPLYFVLGNHDFYRDSIARTRARVGRLARQSEHLVYLTQEGVVELSPTTALVGHDGWADARLGDYDHSDVQLNDHYVIEELARHTRGLIPDKGALRRALEALGDEAAAHFGRVLPEAARRYREILAVTHVPPFREAAWYDGRISDDNFLPHFASKAVGDVMRGVMSAHPESKLLVLCGHTHGKGEVSILENLRVWTGGAEYGNPEVQAVLDVE